MIKHVVFLKFKPSTTKDQIELLRKGFEALPGLIPEIRSYEFGLDVVRSERSFDYGLVSAFDDLDSLQRYSANPEHQKVLKHIREISDSIKSVDFEVK